MEGDYKQCHLDDDLHDFLSRGQDIFRMQEHFDTWMTAKRDYPILGIRYEKMWEHLPELQNFLQLSNEAIASFPQKIERQSDWHAESAEIQEGLFRMYGDLREQIEAYPPVQRIC